MRTVLKTVALLAGVVLLAGIAHMALFFIPAGYDSITNDELQRRLAADEAIAVVDVREASDFDAGHIPGAINIPSDDMAERLAEVPADKTVAVTCYRGLLNRRASKTLAESGRVTLRVEGGMRGWTGELAR